MLQAFRSIDTIGTIDEIRFRRPVQSRQFSPISGRSRAELRLPLKSSEVISGRSRGSTRGPRGIFIASIISRIDIASVSLAAFPRRVDRLAPDGALISNSAPFWAKPVRRPHSSGTHYCSAIPPPTERVAISISISNVYSLRRTRARGLFHLGSTRSDRDWETSRTRVFNRRESATRRFRTVNFVPALN